MEIPRDILIQSGGGALIAATLLGILTWIIKNRDSLRAAERALRAELREDNMRLEKQNELLEKEILALRGSLRASEKETDLRQEEVHTLKESILRMKTDLWAQSVSGRSPNGEHKK